MYFQQSKLSKAEWENCEIPVSLEEKRILHLIRDGFHDINIKYNDNQSIAQYMKIEHTPEIEIFLYIKYFKPLIDEMTAGCGHLSPSLTEFLNTNFSKTKQIKKTDAIRLSNLDTNIENQRKQIYEFVLLDFCKSALSTYSTPKKSKKTTNTSSQPLPPPLSVSFYIYNLIQLKKIHTTITANQWVIKFVTHIINKYIDHTAVNEGGEGGTNGNESGVDKFITDIFHYSQEYIENNPFVLKYANKTLYDHQKKLFRLFNTQEIGSEFTDSRLVFYTAPTGTGKTLSPLGLSNRYKVIYICASRHIGLAFAKNAISIEKKVAFAFGCETAADIRLHYYSAKDYEVNRKSGGISKVDNSNGVKVEIMICDLASYIVAMYYMLSFNNEKDCIMYWDEPTISLDVAESPLHETIHQIWKNNTISNIILSCATLPIPSKIMSVMEDFSIKFAHAKIHIIDSYECKKTISLINKDKYAVLPHFLFENHADLMACVRNCRTNLTILRYFNLKEIVVFIEAVMPIIKELNPLLTVSSYFQSIEEVTMNGIKLYYLTVLAELPPERWGEIYENAKKTRTRYWSDNETGELKKIKSVDKATIATTRTDSSVPLTRLVSLPPSTIAPINSTPVPPQGQSSTPDGVLLTTTDAHTLTDGATIFFAEDVDKIGRFLIHQSKIPETVLSKIADKIASNQRSQTQIEVLSKSIDDKIGKDTEKERKMEKENFTPEIKRMMDSLEALKTTIQSVSLEMRYIPNTQPHQMIWWDAENTVLNAFVPNIDQCSAEEVMSLDVTPQMKMLLLMGIGVFSNEVSGKYMEIMKRLALEERLYLIIANCDFIYGMNYQMCHAFFGKDLKEMTQQKIIQAIGRIGRGNIQQEYTIRIRDDDIFKRLFLPQERNIEAENMSRLFVSWE
jgi:hypothetical protein